MFIFTVSNIYPNLIKDTPGEKERQISLSFQTSTVELLLCSSCSWPKPMKELTSPRKTIAYMTEDMEMHRKLNPI